MEALAALDKQHRETTAKLKQQEQMAQATQRELESKLDQKVHELEKMTRQLEDMKLDNTNRERASKTQDNTINDLRQEIHSLKQDKNNLLMQIDQEMSHKKKMESQLELSKSEIDHKNRMVRDAESKASEQIKEVEKMRQQLLCDLENSKSVQLKFERDNEELKKKIDFATCSNEKKERELVEFKTKLENCQL